MINRIARTALLAALLLCASGLFAADTRGERYRRNLKRWQGLSPQQRLELQKKLEAWRRMSIEEREKVRENYSRFKSLGEDERKTLKKRAADFKKMKPEERNRLRGYEPYWKVLRKRLEEKLPEKERKGFGRKPIFERKKRFMALLQLHREEMTTRFIENLPEEKARLLKALPERKKRGEFRKLFHEHIASRDREFLGRLPEKERGRIKKMSGWERRREINRKRFENFIQEQGDFIRKLPPEHKKFLEKLPKDARLKWLLHLQHLQRQRQRSGHDHPGKGEEFGRNVFRDLLPPMMPPGDRAVFEKLFKQFTKEDWAEISKLPRHKRYPFIVKKANQLGIKLPPLPQFRKPENGGKDGGKTDQPRKPSRPGDRIRERLKNGRNR